MKPQTKSEKKQLIQLILILLTLVLIFGHSAMPPAASSTESGFVTKLLAPLLSKLLPPDADMEHFVRKAAHFTEYFLLGLQLFFYLKVKLLKAPFISAQAAKKQRPLFKVSANAALIMAPVISWAIAFLDETIQIFSGRGPAIQDVWLDTAGALTACLLMWLIVAVIASKRQQ